MAELMMVIVVLVTCLGYVMASPQVPCYFIFGDSLVDNGNNNAMASIARSNYRPYGIDFPAGPTGRFTNGMTYVDVISNLLGFNDFIPPYANAQGGALLTGVNFASAAAGIRDESGRHLGARLSMGIQLQNYQSAVQQIVNLLGDEDTAASHLSKCIYSVGMGSNDYLNNYFMPSFYCASRLYTPDQYAEVLIQQYTQQLRTLYNYGARKVAVIGVGQVGCSPNEIASRSTNGVTCVDRINDAIQLFNTKLKPLVDNFNQLEGAHFTFIDGFGIFHDILADPAANGFTVTNTGCCGIGRNNGQIICLPLQRPCLNRAQYLFWDAFHPTEAANIIIGTRSYSAKAASDAYPMDIRHLAMV